MTDDERIHAWLSRADTEALQDLFARHQNGVFAFMMRMMNHRQDAEDATQRAFEAAFGALPRYQPQGRFKSWLFQIAVNQARTMLRARGAAAKRVGTLEVEVEVPQPKHPTPFETLLRGERVQELHAAIEKLPPAEREVVTLRLQLDCTFDEIADITGAPRGTVLGRMRNASRRLRQELSHG